MRPTLKDNHLDGAPLLKRKDIQRSNEIDPVVDRFRCHRRLRKTLVSSKVAGGLAFAAEPVDCDIADNPGHPRKGMAAFRIEMVRA